MALLASEITHCPSDLRIFGIFLGVGTLSTVPVGVIEPWLSMKYASDHMDVVFIYLAIKCCC